MRKKLVSYVLFLTLIVGTLSGGIVSAEGSPAYTEIYVDSINGEDTASGEAGAPVKSLTKAFTLSSQAGISYKLILEPGNYPSPGLIEAPSNSRILITTTSSGMATVFRNPSDTKQELIHMSDDSFQLITFENIIFSGDDPATADVEESSGTGIFLYSCDNASGNRIIFQNCDFINLQMGILQTYSDYLTVEAAETDFIVGAPISMDYGAGLVVQNSYLETTSNYAYTSLININNNMHVDIQSNVFKGRNGMGYGIYEDVYSGIISGNTFSSLDTGIRADSIANLTISNNTLEVSRMGMDLEPAESGSLSVTGNSIINKGLKRNGSTGIDLSIYADNTIGNIQITNNIFVNFSIALDYYGSSDGNYSVTLGGTGLGNIYRGNVLNLYWNSSIAPPIDLQGTDWGTTSPEEVSQRIYANGSTPSSVFLLDDSFSTSAPSTLYVDDDFSSSAAGGHTFGVDAFNTITEALAYAATGADVLVNDGSYIAPTWIDRPVSIIGQGDSVALARHPSITGYGNVTTSITSADVHLEKLRFSNGDVGISFDPFTLNSHKFYPESYQIIGCHFSNFAHNSIRDQGSIQGAYPLHPGTVSEVRDNIFYQDSMTNGTPVHLINKSDHLVFTGNSYQSPGFNNYVFDLNGQDVTVTGNSIALDTQYSDSYTAMSINSTGDLLCSDNQIINSYSGTKGGTGLALYFSGSQSGLKKEVYRNTLSGFRTGLLLSGDEGGDYYTLTIGGITSNANDFSNNTTGLTSYLNNYGNEPTNATYNIWGVPDELLSAYINQTLTYPVTYLPSVASRFAGGTGTESNPYQIGTPTHLDNIRLYLGTEHQDKHFQLTQNIDLGTAPWNTGEGWNPIGSYDAQFYGNLDGNGKTVSNLTINRPGSSNSNIGLFGYLHDNAEITDLTLQNATVSGHGSVGALAGRSDGSLANITATSTVTGNGNDIGGLVGYNYGTIQDCQVSGNVTGTDQVGGLVGNNMGTISTSFATGDVIGNSELGGLVGENYSTITNSYAKGSVSGTSNSVGGLVGIAVNSGSNVTNCYSIGSVTGGSQVGGALGANHGTVSAVFYNSDTSGQTDTNKGTPFTTAQLKILSTYTGWSFPSIWTLNANDNSGYPALAWQGYTHSSPPSGNSSGGGGTATPAITIITEVNPGTTSNLVQVVPVIAGDTATASVSGSVLDALLTKAQATEGTGSRDILQVSLDTPADLNQLTISLPQRELSQITTNSDSSLALQSPFLSVRFDHKALDVITNADQGGSVQVTATVVDPKTLAPEDQKKVDGRPVFDFTVTNGNTKVSDFKSGHATVTIPYALGSGENPSSIIVYYLKDDGNLEVVRGHYDKMSKAVIFKTKHFSNFLIGYSPVSFADVRSDAWYEDAVSFLSARGITSGTTTNTFSPSQQLTRAQFLVLAMNGYQIPPSLVNENSISENFADAGNRYYSAYLLKAKEIGLTQGIGNNLFAPDTPITRQEMFVLLYNILNQLDEMPLPEDPNRIMEFQDQSSLSAWAKEPTLLLYQSGIIEGSNNQMNPKGTATRAEMAQILYNLLTE